MLSYLEYLRDVKNMKNTTIEKNLEFLRWFLRWSLQKGFHKNAQFEAFRPKFKKTQKKVIFLTKKEIKKLENFKIPETKLYLYRVRDVFLFCCYTGLGRRATVLADGTTTPAYMSATAIKAQPQWSSSWSISCRRTAICCSLFLFVQTAPTTRRNRRFSMIWRRG